MTGMSSGWQWFDAPDDRELHDAEGDPSVTITFARCFDSPDGDRVLQHLRRLTLERALGPGASDALLRHLEGNDSWLRTSSPWSRQARMTDSCAKRAGLLNYIDGE